MGVRQKSGSEPAGGKVDRLGGLLYGPGLPGTDPIRESGFSFCYCRTFQSQSGLRASFRSCSYFGMPY